MKFILEKLSQYHVRFEEVTANTFRVYGNFCGFSVVRDAEYGIEVDGRIMDKNDFEDWLYKIKM